MTLEIRKDNEQMTGLLKGRLDNAAVSTFREDLQPLMKNADKHIVLDCSGLQFISLSGIQLLQSLQSATKKCGGCMSIRNVAATIMQLFTATGVATLLNIE